MTIATLLIGLASPALARESLDKPSKPVTPDSMAHDRQKKTKLTGDAKRQAKNDYRAARSRCQWHVGADRIACLDSAETAYRAAVANGPSRSALPEPNPAEPR